MVSDDFTKTLRPQKFDSEKGSSRKINELLARAFPSKFGLVSAQTSTIGAQYVRLGGAAGATAFRILGDNNTGQSLTFRRYGSNTGATASLSTNIAGDNNDITVTAKTSGVVGNSLTLTLTVAGNNTALAVTASTAGAISVALATDGEGAATSTAAAVIAAINAHAGASALVTASLKAENDGTGVMAAAAAANLAGGTDVFPTLAYASGARIDLPCEGNANEWELRRTDNNGAQLTLVLCALNTPATA